MISSRQFFFPPLLCLLVGLAFLTTAHAGVQKGWKTYKGHYFSIAVPPGFAAIPMGQDGDGGSADEVCMYNEKAKVRFFVYSPLWNGKSLFEKINDRTEICTARETKKIGDVKEQQLTIEARDKSYIRFVVIHINEATNNNTTFGIQVPNMEVYEQFKPAYINWKSTLRQWAD